MKKVFLIIAYLYIFITSGAGFYSSMGYYITRGSAVKSVSLCRVGVLQIETNRRNMIVTVY